jgi:hypothetical protein
MAMALTTLVDGSRSTTTDLTLNGTAISGASYSFGNNRIFGNGAAGTTPSHISPE